VQAVILTVYDATYCGLFYKGIINQYETLQESWFCTMQRLYHSTQLRYQHYKHVYKVEAETGKIKQVNYKKVLCTSCIKKVSYKRIKSCRAYFDDKKKENYVCFCKPQGYRFFRYTCTQ
jgi:hypothetical protein